MSLQIYIVYVLGYVHLESRWMSRISIFNEITIIKIKCGFIYPLKSALLA